MDVVQTDRFETIELAIYDLIEQARQTLDDEEFEDLRQAVNEEFNSYK